LRIDFSALTQGLLSGAMVSLARKIDEAATTDGKKRRQL
jgi:hypothetical protein